MVLWIAHTDKQEESRNCSKKGNTYNVWNTASADENYVMFLETAKKATEQLNFQNL